MKYGIHVNIKTGKQDFSYVREFTNKHWSDIQKKVVSGWVQFPYLGVFISFCDADRVWMNILHEHLNQSEFFAAGIVESKRKGGDQIAVIVSSGLNSSNYFIPKLSKPSIKNQWVNQDQKILNCS